MRYRKSSYATRSIRHLLHNAMQSSGQPSSTGALCISLDIASSKWYSDSCMVAKPYICKVSPRPITPAPTLKPATRPASTTRRIPTTTADRAFHPCQQRVAIVFDASNSLTTADFQVQKFILFRVYKGPKETLNFGSRTVTFSVPV